MYRCGVIAAYCSNFGHFAFFSYALGGGVMDNVQCSSWDHWKARKSAISLQRGQFDPKFQIEWDVPAIDLCMDS